MIADGTCRHCRSALAIRNPTGECDHLHYPENCETCFGGKRKSKVFQLFCEDASHLGGPMGSEYTTPIWTKLFTTIEKAKTFAENFAHEYETGDPDWHRQSGGSIIWDARAFIFTIKSSKIDEV